MTNTQNHTRREFQILRETVPDAIILEFEPEILALCEAFGRSGQSGGSAPYTAGAIVSALKKLLLQDPITPITGEEQEWIDVSAYMGGDTIYQNSREGGLFKKGDVISYNSSIVWKGPREHDTFTGSVYTPDLSELISSSQFVKSFPFIPKTFYVDVVYIPIDQKDAEERGLYYIQHGDNSCTLSVIKDMSQLDEVFEYYRKK